jgi:hypothetical protein
MIKTHLFVNALFMNAPIADCQRFNIGKHGFHPLKSIEATLPWDHIAIDLKEFCLSLQGNKYMLVVVDVCTRFVILRAHPNKEMKTVAKALYSIFKQMSFYHLSWDSYGGFQMRIGDAAFFKRKTPAKMDLAMEIFISKVFHERIHILSHYLKAEDGGSDDCFDF